MIYANVETPISLEKLAQAEPAAMQYTLRQPEDVSALVKRVGKDFASTNALNAWAVIRVSQEVPTYIIDEAAREISAKCDKMSENTVVAVTASPATGARKLVSLAQTGAAKTATVKSPVLKATDNTFIRYWITADVLCGLVIGLFLIFVTLGGMYQLMALQTPSGFAKDALDFGKIEKS
jgi:hypothetical protein